MYKTFLNHQLKEFWRSSNKTMGLVAKILIGVFILYFLILAIAAGVFLEQIIRGKFPKQNPIEIFNAFIFYYFMIDFLIRIQFQELPTLSIAPYLHLNISKHKIINFLNIKALVSAFNLLPFFIFLPFCFTAIVKASGILITVMYVVSIFSLLIFSNYLVLYLKRKAISNFLFLFIGAAIIIAFAVMEYFEILSVAASANFVFRIVASHPYTAFLFTAFALLIFNINSRYLRSNLYLDEVRKKEIKKAATDFPFLNRFGQVGDLVALELKLIIRNKRSRSIVLSGLIILVYGMLMFRPAEIAKDNLTAAFLWSILMTGTTIINYGQYVYGWQSACFDGLLANKIKFEKFIKAKFLLFTIAATFITPFTFFYGFISWKLIPILFCSYLYNIGVNSVIMLFFANFKYNRLDLSKRASFNWQGTSAVQWLMVIPLILLPLGVYSFFNYLLSPFSGIISIGILGVLSLLMRSFWIDLLTKKFIRQRYKIAEGFRG